MDLPTGQTISYAVDSAGRRVARYVDGVKTASWLYLDALNPLAQFDGAGNLQLLFVYGSKSHVPDYIYTIDGGAHRVVTDHCCVARPMTQLVALEMAQSPPATRRSVPRSARPRGAAFQNAASYGVS